ncbi:hypothetical protein BT96DRAFT_941622 [Gymnopus androsaceus JB14]|uniref:Uncharacterized protein n=1 Tax=Gymnopus androsaceus JB14 TaxID=1447944 RepID=A0A6A4HDQ7_9AGAR|nr:hypothetical protein BT96DRAFT_941622 [Gymnopus androsaceus JB14]
MYEWVNIGKGKVRAGVVIQTAKYLSISSNCTQEVVVVVVPKFGGVVKVYITVVLGIGGMDQFRAICAYSKGRINSTDTDGTSMRSQPNVAMRPEGIIMDMTGKSLVLKRANHNNQGGKLVPNDQNMNLVPNNQEVKIGNQVLPTAL